MPDDLTDNEKAATFIGWEPICTKCGYCDLKGRPHKDRPGFTHFCAEHGKQVGHANDDPDMSRPENYMRALEALSKFGDWCMGRSGVSLGPFLLNGKRIGPFEATTIESGGLVKAIPKALAALYDKEHEND